MEIKIGKTPDKTVLITGSSTGYGHATAEKFAAEGWNVVATMRDTSAAGELAGRDNVLIARLDVIDPLSIASAIESESNASANWMSSSTMPATGSTGFLKRFWLKRFSKTMT